MTTSKSSGSGSKSDHNRGSTKIKSDVVSAESSGISSDVAATIVVGGGPVLSLINKRLRNHRKKLNRILQMEELLAQGKPLNREQAQLLQSKPAVSALIDELEKLRKPLASAVSEEISLALQCYAISAENATCQDQEQEKVSKEKEFKANKELPIDSKSDHNGGSTKDVMMSTECSRPSQVDQQNEGSALPLRTDMKQTDGKWKMRFKNSLDENSRLLHEMSVLEGEFERLKLSGFLLGIRKSLLRRWPKIDLDSIMDQKEENSLIDQQNEEDQEEENSLIDQQNEEDQEEENSLIDQQNDDYSLSAWEAERLGISYYDIDKMEEVDWERWCRYLRACNMWVKEQIREYKGQLKVMAAVAVKFPEVIGGKPAETSLVWPS